MFKELRGVYAQKSISFKFSLIRLISSRNWFCSVNLWLPICILTNWCPITHANRRRGDHKSFSPRVFHHLLPWTPIMHGPFMCARQKTIAIRKSRRPMARFVLSYWSWTYACMVTWLTRIFTLHHGHINTEHWETPPRSSASVNSHDSLSRSGQLKRGMIWENHVCIDIGYFECKHVCFFLL